MTMARSRAFRVASLFVVVALLGVLRAEAACSHDVAERGLAMHLAKKAALEKQQHRRHILDSRDTVSRHGKQTRSGFSKRQGPGSLAAQEQMLDPAQECAAYYYPPVASALAQYPPIWQIASIVQGDTEAQNAYNAIINDPQFPSSIQPKGTPRGDFSNVQYPAGDPDCWWTSTRCTTPKHQPIPADIINCPEPNTWGLTYDDGPNCTHNAFYNYLKQHDYTATMFFIGSNVMDWPYQAQRALADGHEIGVHTWSHRYSTALTSEQMFAELWYTRKAIKLVMGITPTTWRAPYGDVDDRIRFIGAKLGLQLILWDHDTMDWQVTNNGNPSGLPTASVVNNYNQIYGQAANGQFSTQGTIVLTHEINAATMDIAMQQLPAIAGTFKHVVPVATCRNTTNPYLEQSYTFPNFAQWIAGSTKMTNSSNSNSASTSASSAASSLSAPSFTTSNVLGTSTGSPSSISGGTASSAGSAKAASSPSTSSVFTGAGLVRRDQQIATLWITCALLPLSLFF